MNRVCGLAAVLVASCIQLVSVAPAACAAGDSAALVVDTADDEYRYCVELPDDSVSGIELIELASEQHGLDYRLGYGGEAVCMLAGVGTEGDDCFEKYPDYWGYWRGDGDGGWSWSGSGAGSTQVEPGDVEGWSWGTGQDGSSHPQPPSTTYGSVCGVAEETAPAKPDKARHRQDETASAAGSEAPPDGSEAASEPSVQPEPNPEEPSKNESKGERDARARKPRAEIIEEPASTGITEADAERETSAVAVASSRAGDGPPAAGLVGLGAAAALGGAGVVIARRRKT
ncbi:MAG: hypothetical protein QOG54_487 [Actinomycetota bacterium]|nr:hypothetical protein [Actinomycetota bacterium]